MAEQKKHAKGGTGKKVYFFLVKVQLKKRPRGNEAYHSGRDLGGLEGELIGLVAHRHVNHFFTTRLLANRFVYGT